MKFVTDVSVTSRTVRTGQTFSPKTLFTGAEDGCWLDPSDFDSLFEDADGTIPSAINGRVGRIEDKSGSGHHAVQPNPWARPFLRLDQDGRPYLEFDGIDDALDCNLAGIGRADIAAAVTCGYLAQGNVGYILNASADSTSSAVRSFNLLSAGAGQIELRVGGDGGGVTAARSPGTLDCVSASWNRTLSSGKIMWGGAPAETMGTGGYSQDHPLRIGGRLTGAFFPGRVYGIIARIAPTDGATLERMRRFMCQKTGVALA